MKSPPSDNPQLNQLSGELDSLDSIRSILLAGVSEHIHELEQQIESLKKQTHSSDENLTQQVDSLLAEIERVRQIARKADDWARDLKPEIEALRRKAQDDDEGLSARIKPVIGDVLGDAIRDSHDDMAEALGPVMGEAIRVQIRDSRGDMIEALYPVIGETVQKAVSEFGRELQRNIDARLRTSVGSRGVFRRFIARLRGVSASELALRDALPFSIQEIFLIQHDSGLLIAHSHPSEAETSDSDLVSGMLTAIRDFAQDSFGKGREDKELDEVQYGDQRIIIQSGRAAYMAVVITGVEPEGFRALLREFVSELHIKYGVVLKRYAGDPDGLPNLQPRFTRLIEDTSGTGLRPMSRRLKFMLVMGGVLMILFIALACFYLQFTIALFPIAFPSATPPNTLTFTPTVTATATATYTATPTSTSTPTASLTHTPTNTQTPTQTFTPGPSPTPIKAFARGNVYVRHVPEYLASRIWILFSNTPVTVVSVYGPWMEVEWQVKDGTNRGWVPAQWIALREPVPADRITPTAPSSQ